MNLLQSLQIVPLHPCTIFSQIFVIDFKSIQYVSLQITVRRQDSAHSSVLIFSIQFLYFFIHFSSEENSTFLHSFCWHSLYTTSSVIFPCSTLMRDKNSNLPSRNLLVVGLQLSKSCLALYALKMLYPSPVLIDNSGTQYSTWNNSSQQRSHLICSIKH